ncbi:MAG: hypothetical protein IPL27_01965 [Lewinellaceae bacterium]|nr:hypothetical protein [Lewinellaceae bacterium]
MCLFFSHPDVWQICLAQRAWCCTFAGTAGADGLHEAEKSLAQAPLGWDSLGASGEALLPAVQLY